MKKFSIILLSAIALVACSKDEVAKRNESAIDFDLATKGAVKTVTSTTANFEAFNVWSYTQATATEERKPVMEGITVSKEGTKWTYTPKKYWPYDKVLDFYAIAPTTLEGVTVSAGSATVDFVGTTTADQLGETFDCINFPDIVYATAMNMTRDSLAGRVTVNFRHAMSQLQFKLKNASTKDSKISYAPVFLTIDGLDAKGTYTLPMGASTTADFDNADSHGSWTTSAIDGKENVPHRIVVATDQVAPDTTNLITNDRINDEENVHLVIPQKKDVTLNIGLKVYQGEFYITTLTKEVTFSVDWQEGYKYIYTLVASELADNDLGDYIINFDVTVDEIKISDEGEVNLDE